LISVLAVNRSNREAKRQANLALSPLMTNISEIKTGRSLIIAMGFDMFFRQRHLRNIRRFVRASHFSYCVLNWGMLLSTVIGFVFTVASLLFVYLGNYANLITIGITLNYAAIIPYFLSMYAMMLTTFGNGATCLERVLQYGGDLLPQEPAWKLSSDPPTSDWPSPKSTTLPSPTLIFKNVSLSYRQGLPLVVKNATFELNQGEHVGVVGKTGAGKSSLVALLFRIVEVNSGKIFFLGKDTATLGLRTLRKALAIITQEPLLLPGTLSYNLDPFGNYSKKQLMQVVEKVGLQVSWLYKNVTDLSAGQKQLMALARLLLVRDAAGGSPALVVLDEPTANIDAQTDELVQRVISEQFEGVSTLTIAHRLETIITSDRVLVMDQGQVVEYDRAKNLLANSGSLLSAMVDAAGEEAAIDLRRRAFAVKEKRAHGFKIVV